MPRRVSTYAPSLQTLNVFVSVSAFLLFASMLLFLDNLDPVARLQAGARAPQNPWRSRDARVAAADAGAARQLRAHPGDHRRPVRLRRSRRAAGRGPRPSRGRARSRASRPDPDRAPGRRGAHHLDRVVSRRSRAAFFFIAFLFAFLYLRALNTNGLWGGGKPGHHVHPALTVGIIVLVCVLASVALARVSLAALRDQKPHARGVPVPRSCSASSRSPCSAGSTPISASARGRRLRERVPRLDGLLHDPCVRRTHVARDPAGVGAFLREMRPGRLEADVASFAIVWTMLGIVEVAAFILLFLVQ